MNQTGVIFFGLLVGFIVFITVRGELVQYLDVIGLSGAPTRGQINEAIRLNDSLAPISVTLPTIGK